MGQDRVTVTLPPAFTAVVVGDYEDEATIPSQRCAADCGEDIDEGDAVRKFADGMWMHEKCALTRISEVDTDQAWLLLADAVTARPSAFKASDVKAVLQNVARIARRSA